MLNDLLKAAYSQTDKPSVAAYSRNVAALKGFHVIWFYPTMIPMDYADACLYPSLKPG